MLYNDVGSTILQTPFQKCHSLLLEGVKGMAKQSIAGLFDLTGKVAIVTGGAMGIGQAIALRLAEAGASVMITDINQDAAKETVEQIGSTGGKAEWIYADASIASDAPKVIQAAVKALGGLDILINNAGIYPFSSAL